LIDLTDVAPINILLILIITPIQELPLVTYTRITMVGHYKFVYDIALIVLLEKCLCFTIQSY